MCMFGAEFHFWFDPKRVFFIYMRHDFLENIEPKMGFLVGILLGLARWWVSRAGVGMSPLLIFLGNISAFAVDGLFHHLSIRLKFCPQVIKCCVGS